MSDNCIRHLENYWTTQTDWSNKEFHKGNYTQALEGYQNAMYRSEVLNNYYQNCLKLEIKFIRIYITSCYNLAHTYLKLDNIEAAEKFYKRAFYFLIKLVHHEILSLSAIQAEIEHTLYLYTEFINENCNKNIKELTYINQLINQFFNKKLSA